MASTDKKSAFLNVLATNLDSNNRQEIMNFWEEKYASRPQFGVSAFLDELYSKYNIEIKKGQLFRQLSRAVMSAEGESVASKAKAGAVSPEAAELIDQNGMMVFHTLQEAFVSMAKPADRMKITNAQFEGVQKQQHPNPALISKMLKWLRQGNSAMPEEMELGVLKRAFNFGYVESCQLYGPVKADQMLNAALQKTNAIPEAHIVPPVYFI